MIKSISTALILAVAPALTARAAAPDRSAALAAIDERLATLEAYVKQTKGCLDSYAEMKSSLAAHESKVTAQYGQNIPSGHLKVLELKRQRINRQREVCTQLSKGGDDRFAEVMNIMASFEPSDHPGLKPRQGRTSALRKRLNTAMLALGKGPLPTGKKAAPEAP
jgi:hypothetical protein